MEEEEEAVGEEEGEEAQGVVEVECEEVLRSQSQHTDMLESTLQEARKMPFVPKT